jgi:signal transduction histidine kinase
VRQAAAGAGITSDIEPGLAPLPLDRVRMRLLLHNLLDNAVRHGGGAQPPISARCGRCGAIPQLAEPFYRPDASRERATGGVGLGLYLCRLIAQAHGAAFEVRNATPG